VANIGARDQHALAPRQAAGGADVEEAFDLLVRAADRLHHAVLVHRSGHRDVRAQRQLGQAHRGQHRIVAALALLRREELDVFQKVGVNGVDMRQDPGQVGELLADVLERLRDGRFRGLSFQGADRVAMFLFQSGGGAEGVFQILLQDRDRVLRCLLLGFRPGVEFFRRRRTDGPVSMVRACGGR
jgi:hypothetical protein